MLNIGYNFLSMPKLNILPFSRKNSICLMLYFYFDHHQVIIFFTCFFFRKIQKYKLRLIFEWIFLKWKRIHRFFVCNQNLSFMMIDEHTSNVVSSSKPHHIKSNQTKPRFNWYWIFIWHKYNSKLLKWLKCYR